MKNSEKSKNDAKEEKLIDYKERLHERKAYLEKVISEKKKSEIMPYIAKVGTKSADTNISGTSSADTIYVHPHGRGYQYYKKDANGICYIKAKDIEDVKKKVQLEYDQKVLKVAENEYKKIVSLLNAYGKGCPEDIYGMMPVGKQLLIDPIKISDKEYIKRWNEATYEALGFRENAPEYYSSKGERMRSKSEVIIANLLDKLKLNYKYEKPLMLRHIGTVHPDFTILDVRNRREIYLEHLGMLDDQSYRNNAIMKIRDYESSGYYIGDSLIVTAESLNCPLDIKSVERKIRHTLSL